MSRRDEVQAQRADRASALARLHDQIDFDDDLTPAQRDARRRSASALSGEIRSLDDALTRIDAASTCGVPDEQLG